MRMANGLVRVETDGYRADVLIDRAEKRNAMNGAVIEDLTEAFRTVEDIDIRAATLLGEGPVFCAGMDLGMMRDRVDAPEQFDREAFPRLLDAVESCRVPTVAGIKAAAPAGAFELTLACDFRVIGTEADYGVVEVKLGTFPHGGATQRLPRLVGLAKAKELVLTGEFVDPGTAERYGLVTETVEAGRVDERTRAFADELTDNAPLGMERAKRALNAAPEMPLDEGLGYERARPRTRRNARLPRGVRGAHRGTDPLLQGPVTGRSRGCERWLRPLATSPGADIGVLVALSVNTETVRCHRNPIVRVRPVVDSINLSPVNKCS